MAVRINKTKSSKFYNKILLLYPPMIYDLWGTESQFLDSLKNSFYEEEDEEYKVDFSHLKIIFSKVIFNSLFVNRSPIKFDEHIGKRLEFKNYIYLELVESPVSIFESREKPGLYSVPQKGVFIFINEDEREKLYYPKEILPLFIFQLKERLIKDYVFQPDVDVSINFCSLFKPMRYILKIKKDDLPLQEKLLYKLCTNLGLIEYKVVPAHKIEIKQEIKEIYDKKTNSFFLSKKKQYNLDSIRFYLSAMENLDPIYQFFELYHVLESYFYKYFYEHIKNLRSVKNKKEFDQIRDAITEIKMLKLVIKDVSNEFSFIKREFTKIQNFDQFCKDILNRDNIDLTDWNEQDIDRFSNKLSKFIYLIRNNIVHTKESDKTIKNLSGSEQDVLMEINKILFFMVQKIFDKNIKW